MCSSMCIDFKCMECGGGVFCRWYNNKQQQQQKQTTTNKQTNKQTNKTNTKTNKPTSSYMTKRESEAFATSTTTLQTPKRLGPKRQSVPPIQSSEGFRLPHYQPVCYMDVFASEECMLMHKEVCCLHIRGMKK